MEEGFSVPLFNKKTSSSAAVTLKNAGNAIKKLPSARSFTDVVDIMMDVPQEAIEQKIADLRSQNPQATPADLAHIVTKQFRRIAAVSSGAVGAGAASPGIGTVAGVGLSTAQLAAFISQAGYYVLEMAYIYGVPTEDVDKRRLLVLTALLGEDGAELASKQLGISTLTALRGYATDLQRQALRRVNKSLTKVAKRQVAKRGASATLGRLMPFGIGAAVGWFVGRSMANNVISGTEAALGQAPAEFTQPIQVDVQVDVVDTDRAKAESDSGN